MKEPSELARNLYVWPGFTVSALAVVVNVVAGIREARAWLGQQGSEKQRRIDLLSNAAPVAQLAALALLLGGCGQSSNAPLAAGMGLMIFISSLIGGEEESQAASAEKEGTQMGTQSAGGQPIAVTVTGSKGEGIGIQLSEGLLKAIGASLGRDCSAVVSGVTKFVEALQQTGRGGELREIIMDGIRRFAESASSKDEGEDLAATEEALAATKEGLALLKADLARSEKEAAVDVSPLFAARLTWLRARVAEEEAFIAMAEEQKKGRVASGSAASDSSAGPKVATSANDAAEEPVDAQGRIELWQQKLDEYREQLKQGEATCRFPASDRMPEEALQRIRQAIADVEARLAEVRAGTPAAPAGAEPPSETESSTQPS